jgi:hypothetical protein
MYYNYTPAHGRGRLFVGETRPGLAPLARALLITSEAGQQKVLAPGRVAQSPHRSAPDDLISEPFHALFLQ